MSTRGFTVPEIIVVMTISGILLGILFTPLSDLYYSNLAAITRVSQTTDINQALSTIENTVQSSTGFLSQNAVNDPAGTTWNYTNGGNRNVLITSNYATTIEKSTDSANDRQLVRNTTNCPNALENNYVFFVNNGTLFRRTLKNPTLCTGVTNVQKQTCAPGATFAGCGAGIDAAIAKGVSNFSINYYADPADSNTTPLPASATAVVINMTLTTGSGTNTISSSSSLRMSRTN